MLKIRVKSKQKKLEEIKTSTYQYMETRGLKASNKTELENIFGSRKRIGLILDIKAPTAFGQSEDYDSHQEYREQELMHEMGYFVGDFALEPVKLYKVVYNDIFNNPKEQARRETLRPLESTKVLNSFFKDVRDEDIADKISNNVGSFFDTIKKLGFKFDLSKRTISGRNNVPNPKSPTGMSPPKSYSLVEFIKKVNTAIKAADDSGLGEDNIEEVLYLPAVQELKKYFEKILSVEIGKNLTPRFKLIFRFEPRYNAGRSLLYREYRMLEPIFEKYGYEALTSKNSPKMTAVITRVPVEVVRMSDFPQLKSCHAVGGSFASCATQEAISAGGAVVYLFKQKYNFRKLKRLENEDREFLKDPDRNVYGSNPISRIRLRTFTITFNRLPEGKNQFTFSIPTPRMFGRSYSGFYKQIKEYLQNAQKETIEQIKQLIDQKQTYTVYRFGGGYYEGSERHHLEDFLGIQDDYRLQSDETEYPEDFENEGGNDYEPDTGEIEYNYDSEISDIVSRFGLEKVMTYSINVEVNSEDSDDDSERGYYTGASEPDSYDNNQYSVSVSVNAEITVDNLKKQLTTNIIKQLEQMEDADELHTSSTAVKTERIEKFIDGSWLISSDFKKNLNGDVTYNGYTNSRGEYMGEFTAVLYTNEESPYRSELRDFVKDFKNILTLTEIGGENGITDEEYQDFLQDYKKLWGKDDAPKQQPEAQEEPQLDFEPYADDWPKPEANRTKKKEQIQEIRHRFKTLIGK